MFSIPFEKSVDPENGRNVALPFCSLVVGLTLNTWKRGDLLAFGIAKKISYKWQWLPKGARRQNTSIPSGPLGDGENRLSRFFTGLEKKCFVVRSFKLPPL